MCVLTLFNTGTDSETDKKWVGQNCVKRETTSTQILIVFCTNLSASGSVSSLYLSRCCTVLTHHNATLPLVFTGVILGMMRLTANDQCDCRLQCWSTTWQLCVK